MPNCDPEATWKISNSFSSATRKETVLASGSDDGEASEVDKTAGRYEDAEEKRQVKQSAMTSLSMVLLRYSGSKGDLSDHTHANTHANVHVTCPNPCQCTCNMPMPMPMCMEHAYEAMPMPMCT